MESYSRAPASDYRRQVLPVVHSSLEAGNYKLCQQAVSIIHKIGKDNRFYSPQLEEDESRWLTFQVCSAINPLPSLSSDIQTDYLQVSIYKSRKMKLRNLSKHDDINNTCRPCYPCPTTPAGLCLDRSHFS